jgi:hypothetical protein
LPDIIIIMKLRGIRWTGYIARMERISYEVLVEKSGGKRPQGRRKYGWNDNIRTHLK